MINEMLDYNKRFVETESYKPYVTNKFPDKKIAILTCMDTRLVELLPAAMGFANGEVKLIKNAGGILSNPFGSVVRSLIVAIYDLGVNAVWIVGHKDCGMERLDVGKLVEKMKNRGVKQEMIDQLQYCGVNFEKWLGGFEDAPTAVKSTMTTLRKHPLLPVDIEIAGFIIDSTTGKIEQL